MFVILEFVLQQLWVVSFGVVLTDIESCVFMCSPDKSEGGDFNDGGRYEMKGWLQRK